MKKILTTLVIVSILVFGAIAINADTDKTVAVKKATVGEMAPNFTLTDSNGKIHSLADYKGKFVVLEWVNYGCPFVKKHYSGGNMQQLQTNYTKKEVVWLAICSSGPGKQGYYSGDELTQAIKDNKSKASAYLIDSDGTVGKMFQAKTTPNMYLINPKGKLVYAGAIDDKPSVNSDDIKGSVNFISAALDNVMNGKEVAVKATQPYGCSVKYSKK